MLSENAKKIPGFFGYYATVNGEIWSGPKKTRSGYRKLRPGKGHKGHLFVNLYKNKTPCLRWVHRLVLETFIGPCPRGMECCHYNDVPFDNQLENLRWDTPSNNCRDSFRNGRSCQKGEQNSKAKLNNLQVRIIKHLLQFNTLTQKEIGCVFNVGQITISNIKCNKTWAGI